MNHPSLPHPRLDLFWDHHGDLTAEHFQHLDRQRRFQQSVIEHGYGVVHCCFNPGRLSEFILELTEYEAIFRDGTHVEYPGNSQFVSAKLPRANPGESLTVRLTLPKLSGGEPAWGDDKDERPGPCHHRSMRIDQLVTNEDLGPNVATELAFRQWTPSLRTDNDTLEQFETLDLLRIQYDSRGIPEVDAASPGAILCLGADSNLRSQCDQLRQLIAQADQRTMSLQARFAHLPIYNTLALRRQTMARLGQRIAWVATKHTHPHEIWKELALGLSELRCLSPLHAIDLSTRYDHDQAGYGLSSLIEQLRPFLEFEWVIQPFVAGAQQHAAVFDAALWHQAQEAYLISMIGGSNGQSPVNIKTLLLCSANELERTRIRRAEGFRLLEGSAQANIGPVLGGWQHWQIDRSTVPDLSTSEARWVLVPRNNTAIQASSFGLLFRL